MQKRGQFYIIAVLIIVILIGIFLTSINYSKRTTFRELYEVGEELKIESDKILDYGVYKKLDDEGLDNLLTNFTKIYVKYKGNARDLFFVFGDENNLTIAGYVSPSDTRETVREQVILKFPGDSSPAGTLDIIDSNNYTASKYFLNSHKDIIIDVKGINYYFTLHGGQYFYFIIAQKIDEQYFIVTNEEDR